MTILRYKGDSIIQHDTKAFRRALAPFDMPAFQYHN